MGRIRITGPEDFVQPTTNWFDPMLYGLKNFGEDIKEYVFSPSAQEREERERMFQRFAMYGVKEKRKIDGDGNCQFAAVCDQLFNNPMLHPKLRKIVVNWLRANPKYPVGENTVLSDFLERDCYPSWDAYCNYMESDGSWGDQITLRAIAEIFKAEIVVISSIITDKNDEPITVIRPPGIEYQKAILLAHWHERHYSSLQNLRE